MEPPHSHPFVRLLDSEKYGVNPMNLIDSIESRYRLDFTTIPNWQKLTARLFARTTHLLREIQVTDDRKADIVRNLLIEYTRPTPFELTEGLARTANKWEDMKERNKEKKVKVDFTSIMSTVSEYTDYGEESSGERSKEATKQNSADSGYLQIEEASSASSTHKANNKPYYICTNEHLLLSPLGSKDSSLKTSWKPSIDEIVKEDEWKVLKPNKTIVSNPTTIILKYDVLEEQELEFSLLNSSNKVMFVRYSTITEKQSFLKCKVRPHVSVTLYPGIPVKFKLIFTLLKRKEEFSSSIYFRVGHKFYFSLPPEALCIPIVTEFRKARSVIVPKELNIAPCYYWQAIYPNFPSGILHVRSDDNRCYHVHIVKRQLDLLVDSVTSLDSDDLRDNVDDNISDVEEEETVKVIPIPNDSEINKKKKSTNKTDKTDKGKKKGNAKVDYHELALQEKLIPKKQPFKSMQKIAKDIVELALNTFLFERTYFFIKPKEKKTIKVELSKIECMGAHNSFYELQMRDPKTDEIMIRKLIRVYGMILPHPMQVWPPFLDMSYSHVVHGFCHDRFMLKNTHEVLSAYVEFSLPKGFKPKMHIKPVRTRISALQTAWFDIKFASRAKRREDEDVVLVKFQILVSGHAVFSVAPPITFEMAAPCKKEFLASKCATNKNMEIEGILNIMNL